MESSHSFLLCPGTLKIPQGVAALSQPSAWFKILFFVPALPGNSLVLGRGDPGEEKSLENNEWSQMANPVWGGAGGSCSPAREGFPQQRMLRSLQHWTQTLPRSRNPGRVCTSSYLNRKQIIHWNLECFLATAELQMNSDTQQRPFSYILPKVYFSPPYLWKSWEIRTWNISFLLL